MKKKLLNMLVCPRCKGSLEYDKKNQTLVCPIDKLAFTVRDGIPVLVLEEARSISVS